MKDGCLTIKAFLVMVWVYVFGKVKIKTMKDSGWKVVLYKRQIVSHLGGKTKP